MNDERSNGKLYKKLKMSVIKFLCEGSIIRMNRIIHFILNREAINSTSHLLLHSFRIKNNIVDLKLIIKKRIFFSFDFLSLTRLHFGPFDWIRSKRISLDSQNISWELVNLPFLEDFNYISFLFFFGFFFYFHFGILRLPSYTIIWWSIVNLVLLYYNIIAQFDLYYWILNENWFD